nr:type II toxin-antitoxin system YhaV family toxin [Myxosarcina sp. GI1]
MFFKVFPQEKAIIFLWLGFPRKEGDKKDCYRVFSKMVERGQFPTQLQDLEEFE